jgi:hypothetical protein
MGLTTKQVRQAIRDRVAAITPRANYTSGNALTGATWTESTCPLVETHAPPDTTMPLAFWVYDPRQRRTPTQDGLDQVLIVSPVGIRFLYPNRAMGTMATSADDWDACADAAEHLKDVLIDPSWAEVRGFEIDLADDFLTRSYIGGGSGLLCEFFITTRYELPR